MSEQQKAPSPEMSITEFMRALDEAREEFPLQLVPGTHRIRHLPDDPASAPITPIGVVARHRFGADETNRPDQELGRRLGLSPRDSNHLIRISEGTARDNDPERRRLEAAAGLYSPPSVTLKSMQRVIETWRANPSDPMKSRSIGLSERAADAAAANVPLPSRRRERELATARTTHAASAHEH